MKLTPDQRTAALATFAEYFVRNYPGPHTIISDPNWHAPKIFRAALHAIESESTLETKGDDPSKSCPNCGLEMCTCHPVIKDYCGDDNFPRCAQHPNCQCGSARDREA